jgi:hypothetical protein
MELMGQYRILTKTHGVAMTSVGFVWEPRLLSVHHIFLCWGACDRCAAGDCTCSLSLWRVVRGSKLMHLDSLIHGLFIT